MDELGGGDKGGGDGNTKNPVRVAGVDGPTKALLCGTILVCVSSFECLSKQCDKDLHG